MSQHGELRSDVLLTEVKGWMSIASGFIGIILIDTVFLGGVLAIFAFAIALWLLPSTETLIPLGVRNWLRRSLFKLPDDHARYFPFANWEEEQAAFKAMLKGIEIDTKITEGSNYYRLIISIITPIEMVKDIKYILKIEEKYSSLRVFIYGFEKINDNEENYELVVENYPHKRISILDALQQPHNPCIEKYSHSIKLKVTVDIEKIDEYRKDTMRLSINDFKDEELDSYVFKVEQ